jgi:hypothetical protein
MADDIEINGYHQEILGAAMEILGLADGRREPILGAGSASSSALKQSPAFTQALARQMASRAPVVRTVTPTKKRRWPLGFGPTAIPPGMSVTADAKPQVLYRGEKLINTGDVTNLFIQNILVGNKPQLPSIGNPISVVAFGAGVLDNEMQFDTCDPALSISVQVQNVGTLTQTWHMCLFGHAVQ